MQRYVMCAKFAEELPGLEFPPMKGERGLRLYQHVSQKAWKAWLARSTMIINEQRLNPADKEAQNILSEQMERFFFGDGGQIPEGYQPPSQ